MPVIKPPLHNVSYEQNSHEEEVPKIDQETFNKIKAIAEMIPIECCGFKNHPLNKGCIQCKKPLK